MTIFLMSKAQPKKVRLGWIFKATKSMNRNLIYIWLKTSTTRLSLEIMVISRLTMSQMLLWLGARGLKELVLWPCESQRQLVKRRATRCGQNMTDHRWTPIVLGKLTGKFLSLTGKCLKKPRSPRARRHCTTRKRCFKISYQTTTW